MKSYVEVAATIYKMLIVEVEHEDDANEDQIAALAKESAHIETSADELQVEMIFNKKPCRNSMAFYDEFVEAY